MSEDTTPLNNLADSKSFNLQVYRCNHCSQEYLSLPASNDILCPACAQGSLTYVDASDQMSEIKSILPISISSSQLSKIFINFINGVWLKPEDFNLSSLNTRVKPIYWPMCQVSCLANGQWQAEMGFDYQVKSSKEAYSGVNWQSQEVLKTRTRWEKRLGTLERTYQDISVPAKQKHQNFIEKLGNYQINKTSSDNLEQLRGALIEVTDLSPQQVWEKAKARVESAAAQECMQASQAQHVRNFQMSADYENQSWSQLLLPAYATWYKDDEGKPHVIMVNAQTGRIHGMRMASQKEGNRRAGITALVALGFIVLAVLAFIATSLMPPLFIVFMLLLILGIATAFGALIPLIWPWQWNKRQKG